MTTYALVAALLLTALNYVVLVGYDYLAIRYAQIQLPIRRVALAATLGYALSQALGFPLLTGTPVRIRLYGSWGIDGANIAKLIAFISLTFWVGVVGLGGTLLVLATPMTSTLSPAVLRTAGIILLLLFASYLVWVARGRTLRVGAVQLDPPLPRTVAAQLGVTTADWLVSAGVLYVLLPLGHGLAFPVFVAAFVTAQVLGMVSHVPGGLGVFEATLLTLMPASVAESSLFAALVIYRVLYYLLPLVLAGFGLAMFEGFQRRHRVRPVFNAATSVLPTAFAALVFVLGSVLLILGSIPIPPGRLRWLSSWLSPAAVSGSHFAGSLVGAGMIVLARGLQRRLRGAHHLALGLLGATSVVALTTFAAPILSGVSVVSALLLWASRDRFYRPSSVLDQALTPRWIAAMGTIVVAIVWLGFFSTRQVAYSSDLWWRVAMDADVPRVMRATVGALSVLVLVLIARLLRATPKASEPASQQVLNSIAPIVRASPRPNANLALLGDKSIMVSRSEQSFLMYGVRGGSWVTLGDPVGDPSEAQELVWRFRDEADRAGDSAVFYQVRPDTLHHYVDMGMSLFKVGEEGRVPISDLTLEGKRWGDLRQALRRFEALDSEFAVVPSHEVQDHLPALRVVSDDWLESKNASEKGFSLGVFDEAYLERNGIAVVRVQGRVVAFATLCPGDGREELSIDLMRYSHDAPKSTMDFVFAKLLLWGKEEGYQYFNLGMAPLAGLESHRLAPIWHRFGDALFDHGERLYNFRGLHDFKEKFGPAWEPRYLAVESPRHLPRALADLTSLVAGGMRGVFRR